MAEPTRQTIRALHDYLVRAFNGEELKAPFYYSENPALREVEGQFLHGDSLSAWVQKAISDCKRHDLTDDEILERLLALDLEHAAKQEAEQ